MVHEHIIDKPCSGKHISWSAIVAGAFIGLGLSFLLNLFAIALGISAYNTTDAGVSTFALGGFIALAISAIVSMFVAGFVSGYFGRFHSWSERHGSFYGFATWCLALIMTIFLFSHVTKFIADYNYMAQRPAMVTVSDHAESNEATTKNQVASAAPRQEVNNALGKTAFATFVLFFLGALASCLGGHFGARCRCDHECETKTNI